MKKTIKKSKLFVYNDRVGQKELVKVNRNERESYSELIILLLVAAYSFQAKHK
jgi:hypothetical protein